MSWLDTTVFLSTFITLIVILDPPGAIPIFLAASSVRAFVTGPA
ncbi:hypothetical protein [Intrasporangium calvum]|uniref:Uncharacterized protein n=1 Tax=Intrasporangium calvum (strain ATCC 23552 / DSM 43043 / JCM 3097 / NBRC 12989 / NCIMB 10167 / NRRL B-3866 / 7 KIP) TaxID=710696 RepID=E6S7X9_INTC7|nr:hypothetical protein [Intrasporangium calvum]ADU49075.1 hypothetical protein Intca_2569 [Intrasporangium calvum DSM 43043]